MRSQLPRGFVRFYNNGGSTLLRLPQETANLVSVNQVFQIEVTDDGIVLRPVDSIEQKRPKWAAQSASSAEADREASSTS